MYEIDHLVVTAPSLAEGVAFVEQRLQVKMQPGGRHEGMGTHNAVLRIGRQPPLRCRRSHLKLS